ncbi:MAG: beta-galactosidase [Cyclobacteriaceae bacterium]|jgi:beta-galactosidase
MRFLGIVFTLIILLFFTSCDHSKNVKTREIVPFDFNWKFSLGDFADAQQPDYSDDEWRNLHVPHDWSIEGDYDSLNPAGIAGAFLPAGVGWYRKSFDYLPEWEGKKVRIAFDGVYLNSTVWINGQELGTRPNGYIGFEYDLTNYLTKAKNIIAVKVDHSQAPSGRWYTGSGIYRHVNLIVTNHTHIAPGGVFVNTPNINEDQANVSIVIEVVGRIDADIQILGKIFSPDGKMVVEKNFGLDMGQSIANVEFTVPSPLLWSPNHPALYSSELQVISEGNVIDEVSTPFGIRSIDISTDGLFVNGDKTILKGICMHHDAGAVGSAVPEDILYDRLKMLKEMGCNAIRTTHNPFAPEFYAMTDSMGFLVMDEAFDGWEKEKAEFDYGLYFEDWWEQDLTSFIKRDRNHPSVILWSIGNEVRGYTDETQKMLVEHVKSLDSTRAITQGRGYYGKWIDIAGFNGHGEFKKGLNDFREDHPVKPIIGTEITHSYQTRGIYRTKTWYRARDFPAPWEIPNSGKFERIRDKIFLVDDLTEEEVFTGIDPTYQSSYDNSLVRMNVRDYWKSTKDKPWFLGAFRWTGFDYLGESFGWPARTMSFGVIDLAGFETDIYYLYQSIWSDEPMVHLLPHWTHPGKEGVQIPVVVYTNCGEAELFLNGKSLGKKEMTDDLQLVWKVPYQNGELKVETKNPQTGETISKAYQTAGYAAGLHFNLNKETIQANGKDVVIAEISVVDDSGVEVPNADNLIHFNVSGPGKIIGVENGDLLDLSPNKSSKRKAFNGKCHVLIQSSGDTGVIKIEASSEDLSAKTIKIEVVL